MKTWIKKHTTVANLFFALAWAPGATKKHWDALTPDYFTVLLYDPHPSIPAPVAV